MRILGVTIDGAFSGADRAIFEGLRVRQHAVAVENGQLPQLWKACSLARSFHPVKRRWYRRWQDDMTMTPAAFTARTRYLDSRLRARTSEFDVILQVGGLFAPFRGRNPVPVTLFCDYTSKLAEINYPSWFGLRGDKARKWYELETDLYQKATMIFTASDNTKSSLVRHYGVDAGKVRTVGEGVATIENSQEKKHDGYMVLFIGIDFERKGGVTLLEAFSEVRARVPEARLVIVGARAGEAQDGVEWLGHVADRAQLERLYSEATVFAMPSICEPFGLVLIEAMAHGLPVIGSDADAMAEIIDEGVTGYRVPVGNARLLAERLLLLLSSPALCATLGDAGRSKVGNRYLWPHVVVRIEDGLKTAMCVQNYR